MTKEEIQIEISQLEDEIGELEDQIDVYNGMLKEIESKEKQENTKEQEPILDKIRAEISEWQTDIHDNEHDAESYDFVFERIYEIIDEHKGSEGKE